MANRGPHLFTIPASVPFLPALIRALCEGRLVAGFSITGGDPLRFASATLYLPNRRACRLARDHFLNALGVDSAILPRIVPIGDIDEDEIDFAEAAGGSEQALEVPPALGGLERRLLLAQLIEKWAGTPAARSAGGTPLIANMPAAAVALADDLAHLIDDMALRQVDWERLDTLVPDNVDEYWQRTLEFLKFVRTHWAAILAERGAIEPAARQNLLIRAEAARLANADGPVIAAGSTGSMPSTAELLATIARLPHGAVVLPGLDTELDADSWELIGGREGSDARDPTAGHPQFAMHRLLRRLGVDRDAVRVLSMPEPHGREPLLSEALRPAAATDRWHHRLGDKSELGAALDSIAVIEAGNAEEEALAIAVALREAVETPEQATALVTPDRALARRVLAALKRWNVPVDDSGGDALTDTPAGIFARLVIEVAHGGAAPVPLLALLKHPLLRLGAREGTHARAVSVLEFALLRGPRPRAGSDGLRRALAQFRVGRNELHRSDPRIMLVDAELDRASALLERLASALAPLEGLSSAPRTFAQFVAAHCDAVVALSSEADGAVAAFAGQDGTALAGVFAEATASTAGASFMIGPADYADLFHAVVADTIVRRPEISGVRVRILGPLEARLQSFGRVVLGALNEGTWPPDTGGDPWLSRPMRRALGLDLPERRVGLSAHDFAQALGAKEVVLTRAARVAGAPTVASRLVQRLAAVAGKEPWESATRRGDHYLALAHRLDQPAPDEKKPIKRPAPTPPRDARPKRLSVTEIENWLRDPYTIYAKHVLRLAPLDAVDTPPGAADRGTVIHESIAEFTSTYGAQLPDDPEAVLVEIGKRRFAVLEEFPEARAFWWPRFLRIAHWFAGWDRERRKGVSELYPEIGGKLVIPLGERTFELTTRADRIERLADGGFAVLDYKTGAVRTEKQVRTGLAPQLTLEAAMLRNGGFDRVVGGGSVVELAYVSLRGGEPPGALCPIEFKVDNADVQADHALARLTELAKRFENEQEPYRSLVHPMWQTHYGEYDHLARVKEWSASGGEEVSD